MTTRDGSEREVVGHLITRYLPRSCTFIHTLLRFQVEFRPVVLTGSTLHVEEFPIDTLRELTPEASLGDRVARRLNALAHGYSKTWEHRLAQAARETNCVALHAQFGWAGSRSVRVAGDLDLPLITTFYGRDVSSDEGHSYHDLFRFGTLFMCEGPAMAGHLESVGCPAARIRIVRIGVDLGQLEFAVRPRRGPFVLLHCGRFVPKKGTDLTIRVFAAVRKALPTSQLWLVGDGDLRRELESLAAQLRVTDGVTFFGEVPHQEYLELARRAHVGLQPSRTAGDGDTEGGAPTVLLELQGLGVPIVSTQHADIPFVVADPDRLAGENDVAGLAARVVELASMSDDDYAQQAARAREFVEREHDARLVAQQIADVYREAIGR